MAGGAFTVTAHFATLSGPVVIVEEDSVHALVITAASRVIAGAIAAK